MFIYKLTTNAYEPLYTSDLYKTKKEAEINAYEHREAVENILNTKIEIKIEECD